MWRWMGTKGLASCFDFETPVFSINTGPPELHGGSPLTSVSRAFCTELSAPPRVRFEEGFAREGFNVNSCGVFNRGIHSCAFAKYSSEEINSAMTDSSVALASSWPAK